MKVLFVCMGNVGRSQMAEAFFNRLSKKNKAISAGINPGNWEGKNIHEFVIKCMAEFGYDLSKNKSKKLNSQMVDDSDKIVVIMTNKKTWPDYLESSGKVIFWDVLDAGGTSYGFHCEIRDKIERLVKNFISEIED